MATANYTRTSPYIFAIYLLENICSRRLLACVTEAFKWNFDHNKNFTFDCMYEVISLELGVNALRLSKICKIIKYLVILPKSLFRPTTQASEY